MSQTNIIKKDNRIFYYRKSVSENNPDEDWKHCEKLELKTQIKHPFGCVVEVLREDTVVKPYFDIDAKKTEMTQEEAVDLFNKTKNFIIESFDIKNWEDVAITEGESADKYFSYHIIIPQLRTYKKYLRLWKDDNKDVIKGLKILDVSVYNAGNSGHLRHHLTPKLFKKTDKDGPKGIIKQGTLDETIIQFMQPKNKEWVYIPKNCIKEDTNKTYEEVDVEEIKNLFAECYEKNTLEDRDNWLKFSFAFKSLGDEYFDLWNELCRDTDGYNKENNSKWWYANKANDEGITIGSFYFNCQQMNPVRYNEIKHSKGLKNSIKFFNNFNVAEMYYKNNKDKYLYSSSLGWYEINNNNVWENSTEKCPPSLRNNITQYITHILTREISTILKKKDRTEEDKEQIKNINKNINTIGKSAFVNGVIEYLVDMYKVIKIEEKMDENHELFAFNDKVFDLKKMEIRDIRPSDYISITTGYYYRERNENHIKEVYDFMNTLFINEEVTKYFINSLASSLSGYKKFETFHIWTGSGGNGKSTINDLIIRVFGDYYQKISPETLTKPRKSSSEASPEFIKLKGARFVTSGEPEANDKLQVGKLKEITGGDDIVARGLYKNSLTFKPQFSLFIMTNDIPLLSKLDGGIKRRLKIVDFPYSFVDEVNKDNSTHRKIDSSIKKKIKESDDWKYALLHILIDAYKNTHHLNSIKEPEEIKNNCKDFINLNNPVLMWLSEYYEADSSSKIKPSDLYQAFKADTGNKEISQTVFGNLMKESGYERIKTCGLLKYKGLRRKSGDDENDSEDD